MPILGIKLTHIKQYSKIFYMEDFKKKLSNIWYYYKVPIVIVALIIFVFVDYKLTNPTEEKFDNSIAIISQVFPSEDELNNIVEIFENKYEGTFEVNIYNVELGKENQSQETLGRLDLDLANSISNYLIIQDLDAFKKATNNMELYNVALIKDLDWLCGHEIDEFYFATRK